MKNFISLIIASICYIAMVFVNFLANTLPINNRNTGEISNSYPNLFAPAGLTFSIWWLIYLLLALYLIYQFITFRKIENKIRLDSLFKLNILFIATSIANLSWIFAWHYDYIWLSVIIMVILLTLLININDLISTLKLKSKEKLLISTPFSVYFWWITVAAIANITVFLVSIGWNWFGIADYIWTSIILLVWALIWILRLQKDKNIAYGLVLIWAYLGILLKHFSTNGYDWKYPSIIITIIICLLLFTFFIWRIFYKKQAQ